MDYRPLGRTGLNVSALGFGASSLGGVFRDIDEGDALRSVHVSLDAGVNLIDVAPYYGSTKAETMLGKALRGVARDRYVLATKVGRYGADQFDFSAARTLASVDESLERLGVDHVDIIQIHDIEFGDPEQIVGETVPTLRKIVEQGKARFVGITGLPLKSFVAVAGAVPVDTVLSYCHYSLNDTALLGILPTMESLGVGVISASPLGMGLLSTRGVPAWHPARANVVAKCKAAADLCARRGASIERLAMQFSLAQPRIASTLVGSASSANMRRNIQWASERPDPVLLAEVLTILAPVHNVTWPSGRPENN